MNAKQRISPYEGDKTNAIFRGGNYSGTGTYIRHSSPEEQPKTDLLQ
jgi:hypothetical protein